ncbi:Drug/Metabolite transporter superfamily [Micromonas pusilla CCMP1545]|uniref:Drug/Metabolite transporter superfamily n=1 Tax=Micromonas pusilla (strain CCMP1545) TaxID=564608 RepID=C1N200_MICPC|nr:Drug/Metabolite transporter superfamily [Micromonas pusilla CCMP1545]EEH53918.1 Drug/Metabolite transporter superfamily [Micromonas pusilla CCMP1545]|eukprot:XP_003062206.1 Drug/Metabolite transporter superfamily [Micromonas pusilla CCMP1545]
MAAVAETARLAATIVLYVALNSSLNLLNRYTLGHAGFRYPVLLTCAHLAFQTLALAPVVLGGGASPKGGKASSWSNALASHEETVMKHWRGIAAIGVLMAANVALNNASLLHLQISYNQVIRASTPVVCAACAVFVEGVVPKPSEALGLVLVTAGVMSTVGASSGAGGGGDAGSQKTGHETLGVAFAASATLANALLMTLSGKLMGGDRIDALKLTFYVSPVVLLALLPVGMHAEWDSMTEKYAIASVSATEPDFVAGEPLTRLILLGCVIAVCYNWVHNKIISVTSATTTTVLGNVKVVTIMLSSRMLFGETKDWTLGMVAGAGVALFGFALYSAAKLRTKLEKEKAEDARGGATQRGGR